MTKREVFERLYQVAEAALAGRPVRNADEAVSAARAELDKCERCDGTGCRGFTHHLIHEYPCLQPCPDCNGTGKHKESNG
ncbi:MAG: hypothetical protein HY323_07065 [Betaproteobacteria bacterium]|nr:hypothetical protein [Betaproteobacteria bacterium]